MKLSDCLNDAVESLKKIEELEIDKKVRVKADILSYIAAIFFCIPFVLIFISLIKTNSVIMPSYYVIMALIGVSFICLAPIVVVINIEFLKVSLPDNEELQSIKCKNIYIKELLNPITIIITIVGIVLINLIFWGVI